MAGAVPEGPPCREPERAPATPVATAPTGLPEAPAANLIAEIVGVSDTFVTNQLLSVGSWRQAPARTGADGKTRNLPPIPTDQLATVASWRDATARTGADGKTREVPPVPTDQLRTVRSWNCRRCRHAGR
ncbi:MAG: hypothetical protein PHR35_07980 [Kiritimatiellae bacterium]|nr:hypothetical protein [Kiritimatiellia bacterium]